MRDICPLFFNCYIILLAGICFTDPPSNGRFPNDQINGSTVIFTIDGGSCGGDGGIIEGTMRCIANFRENITNILR